METEKFEGETHQRLVECVERALGLDIRRYEGFPTETLREELIPNTRALVEEAIAIANALFCYFDEVPREARETVTSLTEDLAKDFAQNSAEDLAEDGGSEDAAKIASTAPFEGMNGQASRPQIADLAFIAMLEFRQLLDVDRVGASTDPWEVIARCGSAHRRVARTLATIEEAFARYRGVKRRLEPACELCVALEIRRHYCRFAQNVASHDAPEDASQLKRALRSIGTAIAMLFGSRVYSHLRVRDRRQIRGLQSRILEWLRNDQKKSAYADGLRLWGDVVGASQMLMQINRRESLIRHDIETIHALLKLDAPTDDLDTLLSLRGLDPALDAQLHGERDDALIRERLSELAIALRLDGDDDATSSDPFASGDDPDPFASIGRAEPFADAGSMAGMVGDAHGARGRP